MCSAVDSPASAERMPDFLIIGAMKAASTTLFRWLEEHPDVRMPASKEPNFFAVEDRWARGTEWYSSLFPQDTAYLTGEASVRYSDPDLAPTAARRIQDLLPDVRLVYVHRNPAARARSHFRHEVRRAREKRPFLEALTPDSTYVARSCAYRGLLPYLDGPLAARLLIVGFDELTGEQPGGWNRVLDHLGLNPHARPETWANASEAMPQYGNVMRTLTDRGLSKHLDRTPKPLRRLMKPLLIRSGDSQRPLLDSAIAPVPEAIAQIWSEDAERLATRLGVESLPT